VQIQIARNNVTDRPGRVSVVKNGREGLRLQSGDIQSYKCSRFLRVYIDGSSIAADLILTSIYYLYT
jgi:hypothetical protein